MWRSCSGLPFQARAAATRARALCGRLCIMEHSWRPSNACPLCDAEKESITHHLLECPPLNAHRVPLISRITSLYREEGRAEPLSPEEMTSAILNGDRFQTENSTVITLSQNNKAVAHYTCSKLCHKLIKERDYIINEQLMAAL